jgi:hypothetical protein
LNFRPFGPDADASPPGPYFFGFGDKKLASFEMHVIYLHLNIGCFVLIRNIPTKLSRRKICHLLAMPSELRTAVARGGSGLSPSPKVGLGLGLFTT